MKVGGQVNEDNETAFEASYKVKGHLRPDVEISEAEKLNSWQCFLQVTKCVGQVKQVESVMKVAL